MLARHPIGSPAHHWMEHTARKTILSLTKTDVTKQVNRPLPSSRDKAWHPINGQRNPFLFPWDMNLYPTLN